MLNVAEYNKISNFVIRPDKANIHFGPLFILISFITC